MSNDPVYYLELRGAQHAFEIFTSIRVNAVVDAAVRFLDAVHVAYLGTTQTEPTAAEVEGAVEAELGTKVTEALS